MKLDELYGSWGDWAERVVFVQGCFNAEGRLVAASIARFEDWFLRVEHRSGESAVVAAWISQNLDEAEIVVELSTKPGAALGDDGSRWVLIDCSRDQLESLERSEISVTRDASRENETWTQTAETDLLSLVCLSARLAR